MAGQLTVTGAQALANTLAGTVPASIGTAAPSWVPGLDWINTSGSAPELYTWNGTAWVAGPATRYIALLTASPWTSGSDGGPAELVSDLQEDATAGYARQAVGFEAATAAYPSEAGSSNILTFGPYTASQPLAVQWAAMLTHAATGDQGLLLYYWDLPQPQQVSVSQSIQVAAGGVTLDQS